MEMIFCRRHFGSGLTMMLAFAVTAKADDKITYQDDILPLIQNHCAKCHNEDKKKADLDLTSFQSALKGSGTGAVLVSGNPDASKLWRAITHAEDPTMPPNQPPLPEAELGMFRKWIQGGLLETTGSRAVVSRKPEVDFALKSGSVAKPDGPPAMPVNWPRETMVHTVRSAAITGLATSPWAPLAAITGQKQVLLFNTESLELLGVLPFTEGQPVDLKFSRNGKILFAGGGRGAKSGRVMVWDVVTGKPLITLGDDYDTVLAADMRPDQSEIAMGGPSRIVKIWSTKSGELLHKIKKHTDWVTSVSFSPNGQMLATADRNGGISIWDPDSAQELFTLAGHKSAVTALSWRSDSRFLASASEDGSVKLWEMDEGKQIKTWTAHAAGALSVAYAEDGRLVTCGRDNAISLWDGNGKKLRDLEKFCELPLRATFDCEGKRVLASDFAGHIAVWSATTGKRIGELDANPIPKPQKLASAQK